MDAAPPALLAVLAERYGLAGSADAMAPGISGSGFWSLDTVPPVVVRMSRYYGLDDIERACTVAPAFARVVPEVIAPLVSDDGASVFLWHDRPVSVWALVDGQPLDRSDRRQCHCAAGLLASLHRAAIAHPVRASEPGADIHDLQRQGSSLLPDPVLDAWWQSWRRTPAENEPSGWMHGDFHGGNILWGDGRIVGLIDWDDTHPGRLVTELAWSLWEFAKTAGGDNLIVERAADFLEAYRDAGGPVPPSVALIPLIRVRLRQDIAFFRMLQTQGHDIDPADQQAKVSAFWTLRQIALPA